MDTGERVGGFENAWLVFDTYINAVTEAVVAEFLPCWNGKLAAADVSTRSRAREIVERSRIDAESGRGRLEPALLESRRDRGETQRVVKRQGGAEG